MMRLLFVLSLSLFMAACSSYRYIETQQTDELTVLDEDSTGINALQAMKCAPQKYAQFLSHSEFAKEEYAEKDYAESATQLAQARAALTSLKSELERATDCDDYDDDGYVNAEDKCPLFTEDKDGFKDEDGCPDTDDDGDNIVDAKDACPRAKETFNNIFDKDGCPDRAIWLKNRFQRSISKPDAKLIREARATTKQLLRQPRLRFIRIVGYGDTLDGSGSDRKLAAARATATKTAIRKAISTRIQIQSAPYRVKELKDVKGEKNGAVRIVATYGDR